MATVKGNIHEPSFTNKELEQGFELVWVDLNEAIFIMKADKPSDYEGEFIQIRDLELLNKAAMMKAR